jgi:hypothetical protein
MSRAQRALTIVTLSVALVGAPLSGTLFASEPALQPATRNQQPDAERSASSDRVLTALHAPLQPSPFTVSEDVLMANTAGASAASQWGRRGGYHHGHNNGAAQTAIILGTIGAIAGAAVLVYANRPECGDFPNASGCGYGTKVAGGAVLAAGMASITIGAVSWR